jgi:hypothetical protein
MVSYCFVLPLLPGKMELSKKFAEENGSGKEYYEFYKIAGITREQVWIQCSPTGSGVPDLEIASIETEDPANTLKEFVTSDHRWTVKFRKFATEAFGMDLTTGPTPPLNELLVDWNERK